MEPTQCIKIGDARIKIGDACIKIGNRLNVLRYGAESRKPSQCIKIGNACIKIGMHVLRYAKAFANV